jgi:small subunit ribosomal protein S20
MPYHASPKKRLRRDSKKRVANKAIISELRTLIKKSIRQPENQDLVRSAQKSLASAASKGTIHKNAAARRTSRLMKRVNKENQKASA